MSGDIEFGKCEVCGNEKELQRKYFRYPIKCLCHSPFHFELVRHCEDCEAVEPIETKVLVNTAHLKSSVIKELKAADSFLNLLLK